MRFWRAHRHSWHPSSAPVPTRTSSIAVGSSWFIDFSTPAAYSTDVAFKFPRDVWALGVCLYCFVTGRLPFMADNAMDMYEQIKNDECALLHFPIAIPT